MPTRKKNRLNKKGKRRNISRKMWGGNAETDFKNKWKPVEKEINDLEEEITNLTKRINTLNESIDMAQEKIAILDHNNIIPTDTYESDKTLFKTKLEEFKTAYGNMVIEQILPSHLSQPPTGADPATKTNFYAVKEEYGSFKSIYQIEKEYNNKSTKTRSHDYFKKYYQVNIIFNSIKQKYETIINSNTYDEKLKLAVVNKIDFAYTIELIKYYRKIKEDLEKIIDVSSKPPANETFSPMHTQNDYLQYFIDNIKKIDTNGLTSPTKTNVKEIEPPEPPIDDKMYTGVEINKDDETHDIAYIFYRLHDVELVKPFLEEVLKEEKDREEKEEKEEKVAEKEEGGKLLGGAEENQIENKLKELLSKIYKNEARKQIQEDFNKFSKTKLNERIKVVTNEINEVTKIIKKYKKIHTDKTNQEIINKIITSKIEEESINPQYTENMTRENAKKILHVYDEKNSKEIKYKYKMTKDMWTDISTRVTENDRKPLIKKILNKVDEAYDILYQDKETTVDINFYKSIFGKNPFPYRELINVTRTGEGVTPMIYGIEELFKLYEDELKYIKDNKPNNAVKPPFKQKKIEIIHKRKNPGFPSIFEPN